ncbi:MAG: MotA/TolQ/ExbB proton channel family protein [Fuerstiella sp.]|nr:MotA/TolQ/ExbB proton channel family protein [Fuerstiella sp.]
MPAKSFSQLKSDGQQLSWDRSDIEQRCLFPGNRFTRVNTLLSFLLAVVLTTGFYGMLVAVSGSILHRKFIGQGPIPPAIAFLSSWCLAIVFLKSRKLALQKRCVRMQIIPDEPDFVLSPSTVDRVTDRMLKLVDDPKNFVLFNRIAIALSNLRNIGRVSDVDEILRSQAESDEAISESSYVLLNGFVWAIPILGFIGTVLGLSVAIGEFGSVMSASSEGADALLPALKKVTGGLGVAFDTTLEALVAALVIQILVTFLRKSEQEFLDDCSEYCTRNIVNKLRLLPFENSQEDL